MYVSGVGFNSDCAAAACAVFGSIPTAEAIEADRGWGVVVRAHLHLPSLLANAMLFWAGGRGLQGGRTMDSGEPT